MINELGKICQEIAIIKDFVSFKSELLGAMYVIEPIQFSSTVDLSINYFKSRIPLGQYIYIVNQFIYIYIYHGTDISDVCMY